MDTRQIGQWQRSLWQKSNWWIGLSVLFAAVTLLALQWAPLSFAQQTITTGTTQGRRVDLRDQLISGLRAFTPADRAFIDKVITAVNQGKLPRRVVDGTFFWARDRAARRSSMRRLRPMVYFRPALTARAKRFGVVL